MRRYLFADFLRRSLEFFGYEVREITNITDVGHLTQDEIDAGEDKLEVEAKRQKKTPQDIAAEQTDLFLHDLQSLNIQPAHKYPKASEHIKQMLTLTEALLKKGHAYQTASGVYFDVTSFPAYGALSGNTLNNIAAGARVTVRSEKKHPADFALWKTDDPEHIQQWDSPWGRGYPGWHIECSAMSLEYLGSDIDIHTGGEDNRFPHHENEIAQSEGATGEPFVRVWMHNRHLLFSGKKLAKREGLQITLDTIRERGYSPLAFRFFVFSSHYRSPLEFSWEAMNAAEGKLNTFRHFLRRLMELPSTPPIGQQMRGSEALRKFAEALSQDLNTPRALAVVFDFIKQSNAALDASPDGETAGEIEATLKKIDSVLGIFEQLKEEIKTETIPLAVRNLARQREEARRAKNFEKADELRAAIEKEGYTLEDTSSGPRLAKQS